MSGPAKGMKQVGTSVSEVRAAYLEARGQALEFSNSKTIGRIIDFWIAVGAPPLSELDAARPHLPVPSAARVPMIPAWVKYAGKHPPASLPVTYSQHPERA